MTLIHAAAGIALGQLAKYASKKIELPQSSYDKLVANMDRFDEEMAVYDGVELAKPATVIKGFAKFVKSRFKPVSVSSSVLISQEQFEALEQLVLQECQKNTGRPWTSSRIEARRFDRYKHETGSKEDLQPTDWQILTDDDNLYAHEEDGSGIVSTGGFVITCPQCKHITEKNDLFISVEWEIPIEASIGYPERMIRPVEEFCTFACATVKVLRLTKSRRASINVNDPLAYPVSFYVPLTVGKEDAKKASDDTEIISSFKIWTSSAFDKDGRFLGNKLLADGFWASTGQQISLTNINVAGPISTRQLPFYLWFQAMKGLDTAQPYIGKEIEVAQAWRCFLDKGVPLTVLLDGAPGCGKTTLVRDLIKRWSDKRTLSIGIDVLERFLDTGRSIGWIASVWHADIVWIDDIDRLPKHRLDVLLAQLDRANCNIPLLLLTTNNFKKLPPALYRAGRVDYIYTIAMQEESIKGLIRSILASEKLPETALEPHHWEQLIKAAGERSGAYLVKYIRRGKVLGNMDLMMDPDDLDFNVTNDL